MADATFDLPALTLDDGVAAQAIPSFALLPKPVIFGFARPGSVAATPEDGLELPALGLDAATTDGPALPAITVEGTAHPGAAVAGDLLTLPAPTLTGAALGGRAGRTGDLTLPELTLEAAVAAGAAFALPALGVAATAVPGGVARGNLLELPLLEATGERAPLPAQAAVELPPLSLAATAAAGGLAQVAEQLIPPIELVGTAAAGTIGTATFALPVITLAGQAESTAIVVGEARLTLPIVTVEGAARGPVATEAAAVTIDSEPDTAIVVNLKTGAHSTYRRFRFNSFAVLEDGSVLAARSTGLVALTGDSDDGTAIDWILRLPISDLGERVQKRVAAAFVNYRASGTCELRVKADDGQWYVYPMAATKPTGLYRNRVKVGKGLVGHNWQTELRGRFDVDLESIELDAVPLASGRRL